MHHRLKQLNQFSGRARKNFKRRSVIDFGDFPRTFSTVTSNFRIKAEFGTPDFDAEYQAAITDTPSRQRVQRRARSHG